MTSDNVVDRDRLPRSALWLVLTAVALSAALWLLTYLTLSDRFDLVGYGLATIVAALPVFAWPRRKPFRIVSHLACVALLVLVVVGFPYLCPLVGAAVQLLVAPFSTARAQI